MEYILVNQSIWIMNSLIFPWLVSWSLYVTCDLACIPDMLRLHVLLILMNIYLCCVSQDWYFVVNCQWYLRLLHYIPLPGLQMHRQISPLLGWIFHVFLRLLASHIFHNLHSQSVNDCNYLPASIFLRLYSPESHKVTSKWTFSEWARPFANSILAIHYTKVHRNASVICAAAVARHLLSEIKINSLSPFIL